uniref:Zinc metalloproteinase n=1 Tax=Parastrongyloides trichosuri TaxID=131310 RepID=A0A0N4ZVL3_PARTI
MKITTIHFLILFLSINKVYGALTRIRVQEKTRENLSNDAKKTFDKHIKSMNTLRKLSDELHGRKNKKVDMNEEVKHSPLNNVALFQGDMILTPNKAAFMIDEAKLKVEAKKHGNMTEKEIANKLKKNRAFQKNMEFKWEFPIPYYVDTNVDPSKIDKAIQDIEDNTCITFKKYGKFSDRSGLRYFFGDGCYSLIGRDGTDHVQDISIGQDCDFNGIIQHETLHAIGMFHEQSRFDRDKYLTIYLDNVSPNQRHNYDIYGVDESETFGIPYNYGSAMQYDKQAFSSNGKDTMVPKNPLYLNTIGNKARLQFLDFKLVNLAYCSNKCDGKIKCQNGGYEDPNNCGTCKCPYMLSGKTCTDYVKNPNECGEKNYYNLGSDPITIDVERDIDCIYSIKADNGKKVKMTVVESNLITRGDFCYTGDALEVQYLNDKSLTGVTICGNNDGKTITSEGPLMLVRYTGSEEFNYAILKFQAV